MLRSNGYTYTVKKLIEICKSVWKQFTVIYVLIQLVYCELAELTVEFKNICNNFTMKVYMILPRRTGDIKLPMINVVNFNPRIV